MSSKPIQPNTSKSKKNQEAQGIQTLLPKKNIISAYRREIVRFDISQLRLPDGELSESVILFPGNDRYIPRLAKIEGKSVTASIPDEVECGFVILLIRGNIFGTTEMKNQEMGIKIENDLCIQKSTKTKIPISYKPKTILLGYLTLKCPSCAINCPSGALIADPNGDCYVDPVLCIGQTFVTNRSSTYITSDGREVYTKLSENQCWNCFNINETVSSKCNLRRLRKVAYNSGVCCGNCNTKSRVAGLNLMELCPNGAISHTSGTFSPFVIDNDLCTGCMICFDNVVCFNNISTNTTLKMVSYVDNSKDRFYFTIQSIKLSLPRYSPTVPNNLPAILYLLVKSDIDESRLQLTFGPRYTVHISPANNNTGVGRHLSLALVANKSLHPHLIRPDNQIFPLPVRSIVFPPFCHNGTISLAGEAVKIYYSIHE